MAKQSKPQPDIDATKMYRVTLARAVPIGKAGTTVLSPRSTDVRVRGKVLLTILDSIKSYAPIEG